jgi:hypothetical protein
MSTSEETKTALLLSQYKFAIDARDKLNDNYHKWMTFYYVANAAILVSITTLYSKVAPSCGTACILALTGMLVCIFWNLSCKGYYYWSNSWIKLIIKFERQIANGDEDLMVYSVFDEETALHGDSLINPVKGANISTPKLTMVFSLCAIFLWFGFAVWQFLPLTDWPICCKIMSSTLSFIMLTLFYFILPKGLKSRKENLHGLVKCV